MWGENISTFINLNHMAPYPPIDIYISNYLQRTKIINVFTLYMYNIGEVGGGYDVGNFCTFNDVPFPMTQNTESRVQIKTNINNNGVTIPLNVNIPDRATYPQDHEALFQNIINENIIGVFQFEAESASGRVALNITQRDVQLFALGAQNTIMMLTLISEEQSYGVIKPIYESGSYNYSVIRDCSDSAGDHVQSIDLKLPTGYQFVFNNGAYTDDHITININLTVSFVR